MLLGILGTASATLAQSPAAAKWEFEAHGGFLTGSGLEGGTSEGLPPAGASFLTFSGRNSRRISSWYFGDGSALRNEYFAGVNSPLRLTPLDPVLGASPVERKAAPNFGFRVSRVLTPRFSVEFTLDAAQTHLKLTDDMLDGVEQSRSDFLSPWANVVSAIVTNPVATSVATIQDDAGRQIFSTGALTINFAPHNRMTPYATVGAGLVSNAGAPSVTLVGNYRFLISGTAPVSETDTVTLRVTPADHPFVTVLGGGVNLLGSARWGIRTDARVYLSQNNLALHLDASPAVATLTPPGAATVAPLGGNPGLQFNNNPVTGLVSTLSGPAITGFKTFSGSGLQAQFNLSVGYFVRF